MSQYPSPYQSPQPMGYQGYSQDPAAQILAPCRRTSVLMYVLGGLMLLAGTCMGSAFWIPQMEEVMSRQPLPPGTTFADMRLGATVMGVGAGIVAILFLVFAPFVRKASKGATITSIVLNILTILLLGVNILGGAAQGGQGLLGACMMLVPLALLVWQLIWLFQSVGAANRLQAWQYQYASQYSQYQQGQMPGQPSQQTQVWQQPPPNQWGQPNWPPQPPPPQQQNWPPPPANP